MSFCRSISDFNKKGISPVPLSPLSDGLLDEFGIDTIDDYTLPLHRTVEPSQCHARTLLPLHLQIDEYRKETAINTARSPPVLDEAFQARTGAPEDGLPIQLDDESDDEMIMALLGEQLEEEMLAIEEKDKMYHQETSVRIMVLGAATEKDKRIGILKISQALLNQSRHKLSSSNNFKERKHQVVRGALGITDQSPDGDDLCVQTFEDIGLSVIEADFSWPTGRRNQVVHYASLLFQRHNEERTLALQGNQDKEGDFMLYPRSIHDTTINICIYFYESNHYLTAVEEDMCHLWQLQNMGVPILPILSGNGAKDNIVSAQREQFANLLARYQIYPKSFSTLLVDAGPPPSFAKESSRRFEVSNGHQMKGRARNNEWPISNQPRFPPCVDILTIHQFAALNVHVITKHILEDCGPNPHIQGHSDKDEAMLSNQYSSSNHVLSTTHATATADKHHSSLINWHLMFILSMLLIFAIATLYWHRSNTGSNEPDTFKPLTIQLSLGRTTANDPPFIEVGVCSESDHSCEHHHIPIPMCILPGTKAAGIIHITAKSSSVDIIQQDPDSICLTATSTSSELSAHPSTKPHHQNEKRIKYSVGGFHQTVMFLLEYHSRILRSILTKVLA
ncbi:hypothetical protein BX666DRAFT_2032451 [Dichotomocladium elegans]|nr:hypothetical protein BX666DRAFT_2032451 [Dichotomocladium elegans]